MSARKPLGLVGAEKAEAANEGPVTVSTTVECAHGLSVPGVYVPILQGERNCIGYVLKSHAKTLSQWLKRRQPMRPEERRRRCNERALERSDRHCAACGKTLYPQQRPPKLGRTPLCRPCKHTRLEQQRKDGTR